jgi:hypothetical protein
MRMNCNLFRAIKLRYVISMIRYCNAWGWKYFWYDTFIGWWLNNNKNNPNEN